MKNYRIRKINKGFIVEQKIIKWSLFGLKIKWIPFVKTSGLNECWAHKTREAALNNMIEMIKVEHLYQDYFYE